MSAEPHQFNLLAVLDVDGTNVHLQRVYLNNPQRAHEHAHNIGGMVVVLSSVVLGDYRPPTERG